GAIAFASADEVTALPALLVAPADPVKLGAANRTLERLGIPWRLGAARHGETTVRGAAGSPVPLADVTATIRYPLAPRTSARSDTLATAAGEPWIVSGPGYVLIASPLTPDATTFPVRAAFVPWLGDVLSQRLSADAGTVLATTPGAMVVRPTGADALELPDGDRVPLPDDSLAAPARPGAYFFLHAGSRTGALVVNPEPSESDLHRLDPTALAARLRARHVTAVEDGARFTTAVFATQPHRRLMPLPRLLDAIESLPRFAQLLGAVPAPGSRLTVGGLPGSSDAALVAALGRKLGQRRFLVVVAESLPEAERWLAALTVLQDDEATALYPPREGLGALEPRHEVAGERVETLERVARGGVRTLITTA